MNQDSTARATPPRELDAEALKLAGGGSDSEWRYVPIRRST